MSCRRLRLGVGIERGSVEYLLSLTDYRMYGCVGQVDERNSRGQGDGC